MEKKRKLPPRAAARSEQNAKKRAPTPSEPSPSPSASAPPPAPAASRKTPAPEPLISEKPPLPKSIQAGNPLPTVENAQPEDLSGKEYQSVQESGVLAESLSRSRQTWIHEGIFEKYWTKPTKRKGVVKEEPNNPPKDSMTKIGQVTITVEPHVLEATLYAVKDPKPPPTINSTFRPIMQYGPPNGVMPPPPKPKTPSTPAAQPTPAMSTAETAAPSPTTSQTPTQSLPQRAPSQPMLQPPAQIQPPSTQSQIQAPGPIQAPQPPMQPPAPAPPGVPGQARMPQPESYRSPPTAAIPNKSVASPRRLESFLAAPQPSPAPIPPVPHAHTQAQPVPATGFSTANASHPTAPSNRPIPNPPVASGGPALPPGAKPSPSPAAKQPAPATAPGADPIIVTLAERASEDPHLRDLMKRVAIGEAAPAELAHFQKIIDQITVEYKKKGGQQGPSADRLLVDGKSVRYYADEVSAILDIVLSSNPNQKSTNLKPPPKCNPLVISLVKKALDEVVTKELVRRVSQNKTKFHDATELKTILDKLKEHVAEETPKTQPTAVSGSSAPSHSGNQGGLANGTTSRKSSLASPAQQTNVASPQQALRSKGPPPALKPDIAAVVLEFASGTGDRYLFPKYSILEYSSPSEVIASFLIVRKGSQSEYGGDPALDYYQPVTVRIHSHSGKHLECFSRVVAPEDEVRRYMDDVMDNMTRAEYVLLAMRLPRDGEDQTEDDPSETPRTGLPNQPAQSGVLWNTKSTSAHLAPQKSVPKALSEDEQYQNFIATIS